MEVCGISIVVAKDGKEYILGATDSTLALMGDTQEDDRRYIADLVVTRMQVVNKYFRIWQLHIFIDNENNLYFRMFAVLQIWQNNQYHGHQFHQAELAQAMKMVHLFHQLHRIRVDRRLVAHHHQFPSEQPLDQVSYKIFLISWVKINYFNDFFTQKTPGSIGRHGSMSSVSSDVPEQPTEKAPTLSSAGRRDSAGKCLFSRL